MYLLHLNCYLLISEVYILKAANELCANRDIIGSFAECKLASAELNLHFYPKGSFNLGSFYPKGCFKISTGQYSYWNSHISGSGATSSAQPICKNGE